jgi:hypothetical protein
LTNVSLGKMIEATLHSTGIAMFRPASKIFSLVLIAATTLVGAVPVTGACDATGRERGSKHCCGVCCAELSEARHSCCSKSLQSQICQCSVDQGRPATPGERRTSDERNEARRIQCVAAVLFVDGDEQPAHAVQDASLRSSPPTLRRQAVLCHWLI